jgi:hypothetical protein
MGKHGGGPSKPRGQAERNGKTAAPRTTVERSHAGTAGQIRSVFGRDLTDQEVVGIAGALPGSTVRFERGGVIDVVGPRGSYHAQVTFQRREGVRGAVVFNWFHRSARTDRTKIPDPRVLAMQVRAARRLGVALIHVKTNHVNGDWWRLPLLGYDSPNDISLRTETRHGSIPARFVGARTLGEILQMPGGMRWWRQNGMSPGLDITPRRGSHSSKTLDAVLRERGYEGIES